MAFLLAGAAVLRAQAAPSETLAQNLVTVELFTSQGCSSCPAADRILSELAGRPDVLALSLPVDYWDYLGWRDTLARPEHTKRQYAYAKALKLSGPYTPQIVIDGRIDLVGSDKRRVERAIDERLKQAATVPIRFESDGAGLAVVLGAGAHAAQAATVWLVRYTDRTEVRIEHGENEGRVIGYAHVVTSMLPIGMWNGAPLHLVLPRRDLLSAEGTGPGEALAVVVQDEKTGPILGAARLPLN